jgi:Acetyltransferase (GNAT) family.
VDNQHLSFSNGPFTVTTDPAFFQLESIHHFLTQSSWAAGIDAETVRVSIQHSLCFALLDGTRQIGFARLITDYATFGYLSDVYVLDEYQKQGLGRWLVECCHAHPLMSRLRRVMLVTDSAPWLYQKVGYNPLNKKDFVWQIHRPHIYRDSGENENMGEGIIININS